MLTHIHIDKKWCILQRFMDENHVHVRDKNLITSSLAWWMKVIHRMLRILFPATITMWGTSPLDHEGNNQSSPCIFALPHMDSMCSVVTPLFIRETTPLSHVGKASGAPCVVQSVMPTDGVILLANLRCTAPMIRGRPASMSTIGIFTDYVCFMLQCQKAPANWMSRLSYDCRFHFGELGIIHSSLCSGTISSTEIPGKSFLQV